MDSDDLSFPDPVHDLLSLQRSPRRFRGKEAHPWFDQPFDKAVVLLDQVIEVFDLPEFDRLGKRSGGFELSNGFGEGRILSLLMKAFRTILLACYISLRILYDLPTSSEGRLPDIV